MARGDRLDLLHSLRRDESPSLGERLKPPLQCEGYPLQQASVEHIGSWIRVESTMDIGLTG